jgi:acetyl-CoA carboxylase, biotin carboxylase subunit
MEMNTRIQVEHPVTEMVTGVRPDQGADPRGRGLPLSLTEGPVELRGHAIECRINAEDPDAQLRALAGRDHRPSTRRAAPGVRLDTHVYAGYRVPPFYDSLLAKLIVHGSTREEALARMRNALSSFVSRACTPPSPSSSEVLDHPDFVAGEIDTKFLERMFIEKGKAE